MPIVSRVLAHGRYDDAIVQRQAADLELREEGTVWLRVPGSPGGWVLDGGEVRNLSSGLISMRTALCELWTVVSRGISRGTVTVSALAARHPTG